LFLADINFAVYAIFTVVLYRVNSGTESADGFDDLVGERRKQRGCVKAYIIMTASLNQAKQQRHTQLIILLLMWQKNGQSLLV
jgi:hypothetical protein